MVAYPPSAADLFVEALAAEFLSQYRLGRRILAVDGGTDAAVFGERLVTALRSAGVRVFAATMEDFQRPAAERGARGASAEAVYFDRYDYPTLIRVLIEPFLLGGSASFVTAAFDAARDRAVEPVWHSAADDAVLVLSGPFLHRPELAGRFHFTVYLESGREGGMSDAGRFYEAQSQPRRRAGAVVDLSDPARPRRVLSDAC